MTEYIYLLQTREFIKTNENIYKIGKTKQENLKRIGNYDNGTILICQFKCNDCDKIERELIKLFREKYELQKDIGNEYFKGKCDDMRDDIYNYIKNENIIDDDKESEYDEKSEYDEEKLNETKIMFPCYKDDECFGGKKKLIKIYIEENINGTVLSVYFIENKYLHDVKRNISSGDESKYYNKLINKKIINKNEIYDINNKQFIYKLINSKIKITIHSENISDIIEKFNIYKEKWCKIGYVVDNIILNNCIVNNVIYCDYIGYTLYIDFTIPYYDNIQPKYINKEIMIMKINDKIYDYSFLRKYTPYVIEINDNNNYYLYNRDYQIIDKNEKKYYIENFKGKRIYLYNDNSNPIRPSHTKEKMKKLLNDMNSKYKNITINKICLNMNEYTYDILNS